MNAAPPQSVAVLPPREGFGPGSAGAIGVLTHALAAADRTTITFGGPQAGPAFTDVPFEPVRPAWWRLGSTNIRYATAVARRLRQLRPEMAVIYNRPEIALALARALPTLPICLNLQNDPQDMRQARSGADRAVLLQTLACIECASEYLRGRLLDGVEPGPPRMPVVVPNAIDLGAMPPSAQRQRTILFVGRIVREKGPDAFIAACASALPYLPGWHAEIIGADRFRADSPETEFVRLTRAAADGAGVRFLGYRDHEAVLQAMARAAIVVMPSRWPEPFGLVALEALASGAALICSGRGGLREVGGNAALYADPDDPPAMTAAIRALAGDPARRAALEQAGRERAKLFDAPVIAARLAELRRGLLAGRGG